ncbi:MAG: AraC family ligand binding domain-containing protein, partial [Rhodocyclaceae bacterium]
MERADAAHTHELFELIVCHQGGGRLCLGGQTIALQPGRVILVGAGSEHHFEFSDGERAQLKFICFKGEDAALFLSPAHTAILARLADSFADFDGDAAPTTGLDAALGCVPDVFGLADPQALRVAWGAIGLVLALYETRHRHLASPQSRYQGHVIRLQAWL